MFWFLSVGIFGQKIECFDFLFFSPSSCFLFTFWIFDSAGFEMGFFIFKVGFICFLKLFFHLFLIFLYSLLLQGLFIPPPFLLIHHVYTYIISVPSYHRMRFFRIEVLFTNRCFFLNCAECAIIFHLPLHLTGIFYKMNLKIVAKNFISERSN